MKSIILSIFTILGLLSCGEVKEEENKNSDLITRRDALNKGTEEYIIATQVCNLLQTKREKMGSLLNKEFKHQIEQTLCNVEQKIQFDDVIKQFTGLTWKITAPADGVTSYFQNVETDIAGVYKYACDKIKAGQRIETITEGNTITQYYFAAGDNDTLQAARVKAIKDDNDKYPVEERDEVSVYQKVMRPGDQTRGFFRDRRLKTRCKGDDKKYQTLAERMTEYSN